jgi:precorrin-6B methylase 2
MEENSQFVGEKLAPYNPTNVDAINIAINLLKIKEGDVLYDLGCGDARFLVQVIVCSQIKHFFAVLV